MKLISLVLTIMLFQVAQAENNRYEVSPGKTVNLEIFKKSLFDELEMACNYELDVSSTCRISSFEITALRPFYNLQSRTPARNDKPSLHIIDISVNSQLVRCNLEFSPENEAIDLKECESSSLKAKLFNHIINVGFQQAGYEDRGFLNNTSASTVTRRDE